MSEARSYDETTVQPPTKAIRNIYFKQSSHTNNDVSSNGTLDLNLNLTLCHYFLILGGEHNGRA